ncbi:MAG: transporter substrate-binding domain-containing protein [Nitrospirae bacterium]|nr:transporter substrate-binding domain-containing protein [Nitrospirota bacterium]
MVDFDMIKYKEGGTFVVLSILKMTLLMFLLISSIGQRTQAAEVDSDAVELTDEERSFLAGKQLRLGIDENRPPFEFIDEKGRYSGISAAFIEVAAKRLGIEIVPQRGLKWTEAIEKTKSGEVDVIPKMTPTETRKKILNFTRPYTTFPSVIVTRKDRYVGGLDDLRGLKVGVVKGLVIETSLRKDRPDLTLVPLANVEMALRALSTSKVDAFVDNLGAITYCIDKIGLPNLKIAGSTPYTHDLAFGVRKDWPLLVSALDKALASIPDKEKTDIKNRWLALQYQQRGVDWKTVGPIGAALTIIIVFVVIWNRRLTKAIRQREQIQKELKEYAKELEARSAVKSQLSVVSTELHKASTFEELADKLLSYTAPLVGAVYGVFYVYDKDNNSLRKMAGYGLMADRELGRDFGLGEGLIGQCARQMTPIMVNKQSGADISITCGMGRVNPSAINLYPVIQAQRLLGVLELAALNSFNENSQYIFDELMPVVAMSLEILSHNVNTKGLLEETQRRAIQLKETEVWYSRIIKSSPDGVLIADDKGVIMLTNMTTDRLFGYEHGELIGKDLEILSPIFSAIKLRDLGERLLQTEDHRQMQRGFNSGGICKDGSELSVDIVLTPLPSTGSRGFCICATIRDTTDLKR